MIRDNAIDMMKNMRTKKKSYKPDCIIWGNIDYNLSLITQKSHTSFCDFSSVVLAVLNTPCQELKQKKFVLNIFFVVQYKNIIQILAQTEIIALLKQVPDRL